MPLQNDSFSDSFLKPATSVYQVVISNLKLKGIVGLYPKERKKKQRLYCSITIFLHVEDPSCFTASTQDLTHTIDYALLASDIKALFIKTKPTLLEGFAEDLCRFLFRQTKIKAVFIKLKKPSAIKKARFAEVHWYRENNHHPSDSKKIVDH